MFKLNIKLRKIFDENFFSNIFKFIFVNFFIILIGLFVTYSICTKNQNLIIKILSALALQNNILGAIYTILYLVKYVVQNKEEF